MAEVVVFHHAQGLTPGVRHFADQLEAGGHRVSVPDLYEGATFDNLEDGVAHAQQVGMEAITDRGVAAVSGLPAECVYVGFSLGVLPAQKLAQTRPGARGAVLCHDALTSSTFGTPWPDGVALQVHLTEHDPWSDHEAASELAAEAEGELFIYPGSGHLVVDDSLSSYDPDIANLVIERVIAFLNRLN